MPRIPNMSMLNMSMLDQRHAEIGVLNYNDDNFKVEYTNKYFYEQLNGNFLLLKTGKELKSSDYNLVYDILSGELVSGVGKTRKRVDNEDELELPPAQLNFAMWLSYFLWKNEIQLPSNKPPSYAISDARQKFIKIKLDEYLDSMVPENDWQQGFFLGVPQKPILKRDALKVFEKVYEWAASSPVLPVPSNPSIWLDPGSEHSYSSLLSDSGGPSDAEEAARQAKEAEKKAAAAKAAAEKAAAEAEIAEKAARQAKEAAEKAAAAKEAAEKADAEAGIARSGALAAEQNAEKKDAQAKAAKAAAEKAAAEAEIAQKAARQAADAEAEIAEEAERQARQAKEAAEEAEKKAAAERAARQAKEDAQVVWEKAAQAASEAEIAEEAAAEAALAQAEADYEATNHWDALQEAAEKAAEKAALAQSDAQAAAKQAVIARSGALAAEQNAEKKGAQAEAAKAAAEKAASEAATAQSDAQAASKKAEAAKAAAEKAAYAEWSSLLVEARQRVDEAMQDAEAAAPAGAVEEAAARAAALVEAAEPAAAQPMEESHADARTVDYSDPEVQDPEVQDQPMDAEVEVALVEAAGGDLRSGGRDGDTTTQLPVGQAGPSDECFGKDYYRHLQKSDDGGVKYYFDGNYQQPEMETILSHVTVRGELEDRMEIDEFRLDNQKTANNCVSTAAEVFMKELNEVGLKHGELSENDISELAQAIGLVCARRAGYLWGREPGESLSVSYGGYTGRLLEKAKEAAAKLFQLNGNETTVQEKIKEAADKTKSHLQWMVGPMDPVYWLLVRDTYATFIDAIVASPDAMEDYEAVEKVDGLKKGKYDAKAFPPAKGVATKMESTTSVWAKKKACLRLYCISMVLTRYVRHKRPDLTDSVKFMTDLIHEVVEKFVGEENALLGEGQEISIKGLMELLCDAIFHEESLNDLFIGGLPASMKINRAIFDDNPNPSRVTAPLYVRANCSNVKDWPTLRDYIASKEYPSKGVLKLAIIFACHYGFKGDMTKLWGAYGLSEEQIKDTGANVEFSGKYFKFTQLLAYKHEEICKGCKKTEDGERLEAVEALNNGEAQGPRD